MNLSQRYWDQVQKGLSSVIISLRTTLFYFLGASRNHKVITEEYPDRLSARMAEDLPQRFRGLLKNEISRCSGCRYCSDVCPIDCIHIETESGPEQNVSWVAVFDIDHSRCMFCGLCVEVCPTGSLKHSKEYEGSGVSLLGLVNSYGKGFATREMKLHWKKEQTVRDSMSEELALLEKSPVGAELRRRLKSGDDR